MHSSQDSSHVGGPSTDSIIMHIDLDAFFAACEEAKNPSLIGRPVVIGADPKKGKGRGIVATANYAARRYGIHSAQPISQAYKQCPHATFLRGNFKLYKGVSKRFFDYIKTLGFVFEQTSIDECYIDLSNQTYKIAEKLARKIMRWLIKKEKITCSIGIGPNKRIAKIASDHKKPEGLTLIQPEEVQTFLAPLDVQKIPGIGTVTKQRLNRHGYQSVQDLQEQNKEALITEFGTTRGNWLYNIAKGAGSTTIGKKRERKSISKEYTYMINEANHTKVLHQIQTLNKKIWERLQQEQTSFRTITIKIRYADFETHTHQKTKKKTIQTKTEAENIAEQLFEKNVQERAVRLIGIRYNGFKRSKPINTINLNDLQTTQFL